MAGGIDWFRWHHGSVSDPKFQLVANKAGARFGDVIAVWAFILEKASADTDRGAIGQLDFETMDFMLGAEAGTTTRILDAMTARGLICGNRITAWEKRQPKREDETANERKRRQREREHELELSGHTESRDVTQSHAPVTHGHARGEKRREEINTSATADLFNRFWSAYPRKVGKDAARKAFAKRKPDEALLALMSKAIAAQGLSVKCARGDEQYVPHPSTWLNEGRWQDEAAPANDDPYGLRKAL